MERAICYCVTIYNFNNIYEVFEISQRYIRQKHELTQYLKIIIFSFRIIRRHIRKKIERRPMVMPIIFEV